MEYEDDLARRLEGMLEELRGITTIHREVQLVSDNQAVGKLAVDLAQTAQELRAMHAGGPTHQGRVERTNRGQVLDALRRGMKMRTIVHGSLLRDPVRLDRVRTLHAAGDEHRVIAEQVQQMLIFDRTVAILRLAPVAGSPGALVIRQQGILAALIDLFEQTWARSTEITEMLKPVQRLSARELEVLALIAEGRSNGAIGRALSISEAAVGKHVASIFTKLEIPATPDDNRRVLAAAAFLKGVAG
ncbi:helix-turn-helix transcriptional regulator [Nonomuraea soli]|uniref:ATP/maltotriose-dependent transcriptional regulator MalT n=1 Tax=Nonomuraea soli TaxID=1032476 RepID=A0A7W0CIY1_9ACTN|nr:LuxR C-terminal-related transcriptional regulator [Nonomuraea soli]MBA2892005.1 ATP/maltotriose-dependent transcriptional regulator MalT [Nonomuraea soli]